jgi:hypothetical protein
MTNHRNTKPWISKRPTIAPTTGPAIQARFSGFAAAWLCTSPEVEGEGWAIDVSIWFLV